MLSFAQIEKMAAELFEVYQRIESDLLTNVASRFSVLEGLSISGMLAWQVEKLNQLGALNQENIKLIAKYTKKTEKEITSLLTEAGYKAVEFDESIYAKALDKGLLPSAAGPLRASEGVQQILSAAIGNAKSTLNLVNTTAIQSASKAFTDIVNQVYLETNLGVRSYTDAIRSAVRDLADKGITGIKYSKNGKMINYPVDAAVRRAILTSTSQTAGKVQLERAKEWGSNLVEISSHAGARPSHSVWQGKIYSLNGATSEYPDFVTSTGYGTVDGLKGVHCGHEFYPFFEGLSEQTYKPYDEDENEQIYKESQHQRYLEREIRQEKRRILAADAIGDEEGKLKAQLKLKDKEAKLNSFLDQTRRTQRKDRQQVYGFGRSEAAKATWAAKKAEDIARKKHEAYNISKKAMKDDIKSGQQPLKIIKSQQEKHIKDSPNYVEGKSYVFGSLDDAQKLVNRFAGTGTFEKNGKGEFVKKEIVKADSPIGVTIDPDGNQSTTSAFKIHYRKTGTHIVPKKEV
jgi:hypothetical protein